MKKDDIRKKLHSMIDAIEEERQLKAIWRLMEPEVFYQTTNWFDSLREEQLSRLNNSLNQSDKGEFIDHETVKSKHSIWLK